MSPFDRYMIHVDIGTDEKLVGLTNAERLCHAVGVLAVAAKSPIRGYLIVGDGEATPAHIARRAAVSERVARSTLAKLIALGVLERDNSVEAWHVHNWETFNPAPKQDRTRNERQARFRRNHAESNAQSNAVTNAPVTPLKEKEEVEGKEGEGARATLSAVHPQLEEVLAVLNSAPGLVVDDMAVNAALISRNDCEALEMAQIVASWAHEGGLRVPVANRLLRSAAEHIDRREAGKEGARQAALERATRNNRKTTEREQREADDLAALRRLGVPGVA